MAKSVQSMNISSWTWVYALGRVSKVNTKNPEEATRHFKVGLYVKFVQVKPRRALEAESKTSAVGLTSSCPRSPAGNSWLRAA